MRHPLETHGLPAQMLAYVSATLDTKSLMLSTGSAVNATLIATPSLTKNKSCSPEAEMRQTKDGNDWYPDRKMHVAVEARGGLVHHPICTSTNFHDLRVAHLSASIDALNAKSQLLKASIRVEVDHPFRVIKRRFGHGRTRRRGLAKNAARTTRLFKLWQQWMAHENLQGELGQVHQNCSDIRLSGLKCPM